MIPEPLGRTAHLLGPPQPPAPNESRRIESPHHAASRMHAQYCTALDWYPICMTSVMPSVAPTPSRSQPPIRTDEHSVGIPLGVGLVGNGRKETSHLLVSKAATTEPVSRYVAPGCLPLKCSTTVQCSPSSATRLPLAPQAQPSRRECGGMPPPTADGQAAPTDTGAAPPAASCYHRRGLSPPRPSSSACPSGGATCDLCLHGNARREWGGLSHTWQRWRQGVCV